MSKSLNIPPVEMIDRRITIRRDYEKIILWMLNNNEYCEWRDFIEEPVDIKKSTLSDKLRSLIAKGFVEKDNIETNKGSSNVYRITSKGKERFNELSITTEERYSYPPKKIINQRNYDHWILWMTYNNDYCTWSTFTSEDSKVRINQSSLSKNINMLLDKEHIIKVNKEYRITPEGREQYLKMLREYDLDRQSILDEEANRVDEITKKTSEFFEEFEIEDEDLKFRFLNNILKLEYSKAEEFVEEEEFNKIILYLSINHPDYYPNNVSPEEFSLKYTIKKTTLDFFVDKIVEENDIYPIKFFKLIAEENRNYYFQAGGELEKILNAIVEKHIKKFTYLNKFHATSESESELIDIEQALNQILDKVSGFLFNEKLKGSLKKFLPEYINYLAYKIESEKKLFRSEDRLEAAQWQTFQSIFQGYNAPMVTNGNGNGEDYYSIHKMYFEALDIVYLSKLDFVSEKQFEDEYISVVNLETFRKIVSKLNRNKIAKAKKVLEAMPKPMDPYENMILEDIISGLENEIETSIQTSENLISQKPESYIGYLFKALNLFKLSSYEEALKVVEDGLIHSNHYSLQCTKAQILIKKAKTKDALKLIEGELEKDPKNIFLLRTKFIILLTDEGCWGECAVKPLDIIDEIITLSPDNKSLYVLKAIALCIMQKYKDVKRFLNKEVNLSLVTKNPRINTAAFFVLAYSYIARDKFEKALKKGDEVIIQYENHPISYFTKALAIGYSLIYAKELNDIVEENFLEMINKAISLDPIKFHQAKYYQLMSDVFVETRGIEEATEAIDKAISLDSSNMGIYEIKLKLLMMDNKLDEAIALVNQLYENKYLNEKDSTKIKSFLIFVKAEQTQDKKERLKLIKKSLAEIEPIIEDNQEDIGILNNLTILYAHLGRKEEAIRTAEKMTNLNPNDGNLFDSYGETLMILGEYEQAITKFERAIKLEPKGWFAYQTYLKMGTCYEKLTNLDKAEENYLKGNQLTDKMHPLKKDMYSYKANEKLEGLRKLREELGTKRS
jgi:tetratricopeptide (TPR) repeat protein/DNA-binding HxlR family transcriptional regulator